MKTFLFLIALLTSVMTFAAGTGDAPYFPELDVRLTSDETNITALQAQTDGHYAKHTARVTYNPAVDGGATGNHPLVSGITIPAKAIIIRSYMEVVTAFTGVTGSTIAVSCETSNNIITATGMLSYVAGQVYDGVSTGASSVFKLVTAACPINAVVATQAMSTGKINVYIDYVIHD